MTESSPNVIAHRSSSRFQFTTGELLFTLIAAFAGTAALVPALFPRERLSGRITIEVGTFLGAVIAMKCTRLESKERSAWWCSGIISGWIAALLFRMLLPLADEFRLSLFPILLVFSPSLLGGIMTFFRARRATRDKLTPAVIWNPTIVSFGINLFLICGFAILIPPICCGCHTETAAAASCKAYAEAQEIYHRTDYTGNGVLKYAQHLHGTDSLLETKDGFGDLALIDKTFGNAEIGYPETTPKAGYVFKILKRRGWHVRGGRKTYTDNNGDMTKGYARSSRGRTLTTRPVAIRS